ncbi:hypothetical protein P9166_14420 [Lactococcus lactis]|nr:hypothetical protein P9166_14420 [Lactococcus lactis]
MIYQNLRKLSYGINLTIKESTILLESMKGFIDDKIELQERCDRYEKALTEMRNAFGGATFIDSKNKLHSVSEYVSNVLAAIKKGENNEI